MLGTDEHGMAKVRTIQLGLCYLHLRHWEMPPQWSIRELVWVDISILSKLLGDFREPHALPAGGYL